MATTIQSTRTGQLKTQVDRWFADGDTWAGLFENQDLGHRDVGQRCAFPFSASDGSFEKAEVGKTRAQDGRTIGLGWRYILKGKTKTAQKVLDWLEHKT